MDIQIKSCLKGAKEAKGLTVIIDVFRASNTIITCLNQGAEYIIPVGTLEAAHKLKKESPDHLLFGERQGSPPKGFDYGNSPAETSQLDLHDEKIIFTTSAGSQGILNAVKSDEIIIGSFANAKSIINYIRKKNPQKVTLVAIGHNATEKASEDELCAEYIKEKLLDKNPDFENMKKETLEDKGSDRLRKLNQEDDLDFSLKLDISNIVPRVDKATGRIII